MIFYITFSMDSVKRGCYQRILADSEIEARECARQEYGDSWSGFYYEDEGKEIIKKYSMEKYAEDIDLTKEKQA